MSIVGVIASSRNKFAHNIPETGTIRTTVEAFTGPTRLIKTTYPIYAKPVHKKPKRNTLSSTSLG